MADFNKSVDLDKGLNKILDKIDSKAEELRQKGEDAGGSFGIGWDDGFDDTINKIKASSIKMEKAFSNLGEKLRKQVQELTAKVKGKDFKLKIDFSDIDMNSSDIKQKIDKIVKEFSKEGLIEFDVKGSEQQFKNLIALYVKYQEKINSLKVAAPNLTSTKDMELNLRQQLMLALKLREIYSFLGGPLQLASPSLDIQELGKQLSMIQKVIKQTGGGDSKLTGDYSELADILKEIQGSLKVISDIFKNENNSMKAMAEGGKTSFESLSQAIIGVYNNLTQVQSLVDSISQKDFNITNITQTGGAGDNKVSQFKEQAHQTRQALDHAKQLADEVYQLIPSLKGDDISSATSILSDFFTEDFDKQFRSAKTVEKLTSMQFALESFITTLIKLNELRGKYGLGEWTDTFVPAKQPSVKPAVTQKPQEADSQTHQTQTPVVDTSSETQQMGQLKTSVDDVAKAIGRKNAGFIKEKEIVDQSVNAESAKLRELVGVITDEIGRALDGIKEKFAQSFVVPELDKNGLQASFDEIYNKFIELKDKIGTMQIDIGINTANITTAIQEALYAKDIAANYKKAGFYDIFNWDIFDSSGNMMVSNITGEAMHKDDARAFYDADNTDYFVTKEEGRFIGSIQDVIDHLVKKPAENTGSEQENWVQVIVEAINTQGSNIAEAIKLILPKNISDDVNEINTKELSDAFQVLVNAIERFGQQTGKKPDAFFRTIQANDARSSLLRTPEVDSALRTLGLISSSGEIKFVMPDTGIRNIGVAIGEKLVASGQEKGNVSNASELMKKLDEAAALGASVPRILALIEKNNIPLGWNGNGEAVFELQTRSPGVNIASSKANNDFANVTDEQIDRLIHTFEVMSKVGLYPDFIGDNILFDKEKGFSLIDLDTKNIHSNPMDTPEDMVKAFLKNVYREANLSSSDFQTFANRVNQRVKLPPEQRLVNANTIAAEQAVASKAQAESKPSEVKITPTMEAGAVAKVVEENIAKTPATVKVVPVVDSASNTKQAIDGESQSAVDAAKNFVDAANAKKQFVEANKQVAEGAKESAQEVKEEAKAAEQAKRAITVAADNTVQPNNWDRVAQLQADHGEDPFAMRRSKTENDGDKSVRTIVESWTAIKDEDGNLTGEMELNTVQIINDFKKRTDAIAKESEKIKTAQAYLQKFLTQFNNKTMGKGSLLNGYKDLEDLANSPNFKIDDIAKAEQMMSNLDAEYNKVVQSMRKGSSSMNPFVNAINSMDKMEDVLRGISLQFKTLNQQPDWLNNDIIGLYKQLDALAVETDIYKFAEGFGNLKVAINSVTESIRQQRAEQKLATADFNALVKATKARDTNTEKAAKEEDGSLWKTYYLDRAAEQQKIIDAIRIGLVLTDAQEAQLNALAEKHALVLRDITSENNKIEEQKQKYEEIMRLLEKNRADQLELDNDDTLSDDDRDEYQKILNEERAQIEALIKGADLNPEQTKSIKQFTKPIEEDRLAKIKEYINLLKLQQDYEKKAAKEQDGSKMHAFYNDQVAKVKEKIKTIDVDNIANQEEKNRLLALEEAHQRAIAEILAKKNASGKKSTEPFEKENEKINKKYEAGYISQDSYDQWRIALSEYNNYIKGVTEADEATIASKKQSLIQLYDMMTKMSNTSKSFFSSGGEMLPKEMWLNKGQINNMSDSLMVLYNNIASERFNGMTTAVTRLQPELGKLFFTVNDGNGSLSQYVIHVNKATGATKLLTNNTKPALTVLQRFGQTLKKDFTGLLRATIGGSGIYAFVRYVRQGVQAVRELDLALTELRKVTDETEETYDRFLDTAAQTGARIGRTITDVTSATAEFAKLGYDINAAANMAESALIYANVGDNVDVETGSQSIISTMKAFGVEADNTMSIVDKFNEVGNNFAITTKGIGDALQVSASAMAAAGNTLDETIALTTAANTIVQNPNTVGTALKTLSLRIRGVKTELEEAGLETEGMAETTSQLQAKLLALTDGKVDIMIDANNFKSTTQILREMAAEWENLTDVEQAAALELLGGKRQANTLSAVISNFDIVEDAINASAKSAGSAMEENAKVLDSIQGRINQFNNALQTMWNNALDSKFVKGVVGFGTDIVKIIDKIGLLNAALIALGAYKGFGVLFKTLKNGGLTIDVLVKSILSWATGIDMVNTANAKQIFIEKVLRGEWVKSLATLYLRQKVEKAGINVSKETIKSYVEQMGTAKLLTAGIKGLGTAFVKLIKTMWPLAAAAVVITGLTHVIDAVTDTTEELKEKFDEASDSLSNTVSKLQELESQLSEVNSQIEELNAQESLSFTEQEQLDLLRAQSDELQRQIDLSKILQEQQKISVNKSGYSTAENYKNIGTTTGKTTEENVGGTVKTVGGIGAGVTGVAATLAAAGTAMSWNVVGWIALAAAAVTAAAGAIAYGVSEAEVKVGDSIDNMREQYSKLEQEYKDAQAEYHKDASDSNKKKFEKAQTAFLDYQSEMSNHLGTLNSYYSQMDWETATDEQRKSMREFYDTQDKWAIQSGGQNAKSNAIARIFGDEAEGGFAKVKAQVKATTEETKRLQEELVRLGKNGSVDLTIRPKVDASEMQEAGWDVEDGSISTVNTSTFTNEDETIAMNFTPILPNGKVLTPDELQEYAEAVIAGAREDDLGLKIGATFSGDDAIAQAEGVAQTIHELHEKYFVDSELDLSVLSDEEVQRLRDMGLYLYEVEDALKNVVKAEAEVEDFSLLGVAKDITNVAEGLESLKSAFNEVTESGLISAKTLVELEEEFGDLEDSWSNYVNTMFSGVASTKEMTEATEELAQAWADKHLSDLTEDKRATYIIQLKMLGVENAAEYIDDKLEEKKYADIFNSATAFHDEHNGWSQQYKQELEDTYGLEAEMIDELLDKTEEYIMKKGELEGLQGDKEKYDTFSGAFEQAQENIDVLEKQLNGFNPDDWERVTYETGETSYYNGNEVLSLDEYTELNKKYKDIQEAKQKLNDLINDGVQKGWVTQNKDGTYSLAEGVSAEFEAAIKAAEDGVAELEDELKTGYTADIKLKVEVYKASQAVDDIQSIFDTLKDAKKEYNEEGYFSVDTMQSLLEMDAKYLDLLYDENGNLNLNEQALYNVAIARLTNLKLKQQDAILTEAETLAANGSMMALMAQVDVMADVGGAYDVLIEKRLESIRTILAERQASGELVGFSIDSYINGLKGQLNAVERVSASAIGNIRNSLSSSGNTAKADAEDAFKKAMDYWENRIGANQARYDQIQNEIDLLEKKGKIAGKEYYEEQIKLENERLKLLEAQKAEAKNFLGTFKEGSDEWFRKKPVYWETNKCNPLNCWNSLRVLYTTTQG